MMLVSVLGSHVNPDHVVRVYRRAGTIQKVWHAAIELDNGRELLSEGQPRIDAADGLVDAVVASLNRTSNPFVSPLLVEQIRDAQDFYAGTEFLEDRRAVKP